MTKHFLDIQSIDKPVLEELLDTALEMKQNKKSYSSLEGKTVGLLFEKPSLRTRVSFEVGIRQLGGSPITLHKNEVGLGEREDIKDVSRVLSRYVDMVMIRTFDHAIIEEFARYSSIPVINGLTDASHPCQAVADLLTIKENFQDVNSIHCTYVGDGNNVCRSFLELCGKLGISAGCSTPKGFECDGYDSEYDVRKAIKNSQVIYTDTWVSMGEEESGKSIDNFTGYQVNAELLKYAPDNAIILHCLPAHKGEEITESCMEGSQSRIFDQAENRLHAQKAIMDYLTH
ncbi:ornithine carbamoyltransferase [Candidatus Marinamargulisbacteria bacterium SCGC AG-343-D04]|nr:ornithine carbamoyltransferase [Candidatus Marinamargulisbacteria bacterium SCGC AG-343-D04]